MVCFAFQVDKTRKEDRAGLKFGHLRRQQQHRPSLGRYAAYIQMFYSQSVQHSARRTWIASIKRPTVLPGNIGAPGSSRADNRPTGSLGSIETSAGSADH